MDPGKAVLVVCITLFIVIGINAALIAALRRGNEATQIDLLRKAAARVKQPWQAEDEALKELSRRVEELKSREAEGKRYEEGKEQSE